MSTIWNDPNWGDGTFVDPGATGGGTAGGDGSNPIVAVQSTGGAITPSPLFASATESVTATFPSPITAGNTIFVWAFAQVNGPGAGMSSPSVIDTLLNVYTSDLVDATGGSLNGAAVMLFHAANVLGGADDITFSFDFNYGGAGGNGVSWGFVATEYSGMGATPTVHSTADAKIAGTSGNAPVTLTLNDSHGTSVSVTFGNNITPSWIGTVNTGCGIADVVANGADYILAGAYSQNAAFVVPTSSYTVFQQEELAADGASSRFVYAWDPGTVGGGGGGSPSIVLNPAQGVAGQTYNLSVTGTDTHFVGGSSGTAVTVSGGGVTVSNVAVTDSTDLTFTLALSPGATLGARTVTTQTGAEAPSATFTVLQSTVSAVKRGDIGWSQIRLGLDGTWGAGDYGQSTDGSGLGGYIPIWGGPDAKTLVLSGLTAASLAATVAAAAAPSPTPIIDSETGEPIFDENGDWIFEG
jgi:hypothetical protein